MIELLVFVVFVVIGGTVLLNSIAYKQTHFPDGTMRPYSKGYSTKYRGDDDYDKYSNNGYEKKQRQNNGTGIFDPASGGGELEYGSREYDAYCQNAENEDFNENDESTWAD